MSERVSHRHLALSATIVALGAATASADPIITTDAYWDARFNSPSSTFENCFPKQVDSDRTCDPVVLFGRYPQAIETALTGKTSVPDPSIPIFVVTYGPPASGKSSIRKWLHDLIKLQFEDGSSVDINVDDIFQNKGMDVGQKFQDYQDHLKAWAADQKLTAERQKILLQRLYWLYRWPADQISDLILNRALFQRNNVFWETTGGSQWPTEELARIRTSNYHTVVVYPVARTEQLVARAAQRADQTGQVAAPEADILAGVTAAQKNLVLLLPARLPGQADIPRTGSPAHRVIIIDNTATNAEQASVFYDSDRPGEFCSARKAMYNVVTESTLWTTINTVDRCSNVIHAKFVKNVTGHERQVELTAPWPPGTPLPPATASRSPAFTIGTCRYRGYDAVASRSVADQVISITAEFPDQSSHPGPDSEVWCFFAK